MACLGTRNINEITSVNGSLCCWAMHSSCSSHQDHSICSPIGSHRGGYNKAGLMSFSIQTSFCQWHWFSVQSTLMYIFTLLHIYFLHYILHKILFITHDAAWYLKIMPLKVMLFTRAIVAKISDFNSRVFSVIFHPENGFGFSVATEIFWKS